MVYLEEIKEKRKSSLIVVCTLGVAALFYKNVRPIWMTNLFGRSEVFYDDTCAEAESYTQQVYLNFVNGIGSVNRCFVDKFNYYYFIIDFNFLIFVKISKLPKDVRRVLLYA